MSEEISAKEKLKIQIDKLKEEKRMKEEQDKKETAIILNNLASIKQNAELAKMYADNAKVGADNLAGELPLLKVHQVGKSTKNQLSDGGEPNDGWFFYRPTGEQFQSIKCHILTISRGFRAEGIDENKKDIFNQIVGGVIVDGTDYKPFVLYMTGLKLKPLWEFGKVAGKYTHLKPIPIPMFALMVKMTTQRVDNSYGRSWVINFEIEKDQDGNPVLVGDSGEFQYLRDNVETVEDTIAGIVDAKTAKEAEEIFSENNRSNVKPAKVVDAKPTEADIPF